LLAERRVPARRGWAGENSELFEHHAEFKGIHSLRPILLVSISEL
jgi:hypothetical protein